MENIMITGIEVENETNEDVLNIYEIMEKKNAKK